MVQTDHEDGAAATPPASFPATGDTLLADAVARVLDQQPELVSRAVVSLHSSVRDADGLADVLRRAADTAVRCLPGVASAGVAVRLDDAVVTAAATGPQVQAVDTLQHELGDGPCLTALRTARVVTADAAAARQRWPELASRSRAEGVCSFLAAPLVVAGTARGSLNLYGRGEGGFSGVEAGLVAVLADQVSRVLADFTEPRTAREQAEQLRAAMAGRAAVEQATGILMAVHQVDADGAFELLRAESQRTGTTLGDLAHAVVAARAGRPVASAAPAPARSSGAPATAAASGALDFRSAFEHAPVGMAIADPAGVLRTVNAVLAALLGESPARLVGRTLLEATHPEDVAAAQAACRALQDGPGTTAVLGVRLRGAVGQWVPVTVSTATVPASGGGAAHLVVHVQDVTDHHRLAEQLRHEAMHDPLTGLANRALFLDRLTGALRRGREASPVVVLFCDVDDLKLVNDTHGHHVGDLVLRALADRLRGVVRPGDTTARLGGDEMAVLCEQTAAVAELVARVRDALDRPLDADGTAVSVTVSIGAATSPSGDGATSAHALLVAADAAMYVDKRQRRARAR